MPNCHGPAIHGPMVDESFGLIRRIPDLIRWTEPSQADLEALLRAAGFDTSVAGPYEPY